MQGDVECTVYVLPTRKHIYLPNNSISPHLLNCWFSPQARIPYHREGGAKHFRTQNIWKPPISHLLYKVHTPNLLRCSLLSHLHTSHCWHFTHPGPKTCSLLMVPVRIVQVILLPLISRSVVRTTPYTWQPYSCMDHLTVAHFPLCR